MTVNALSISFAVKFVANGSRAISTEGPFPVPTISLAQALALSLSPHQ